MLVRGQTSQTRSNAQLEKQMNNLEMDKLIELFDEEQEQLYQRAIKNWQDGVIKQQNATQVT